MAQGARTIGIRQVLAEVNLRDFSRMVFGELALVGSSVRLAAEERRLALILVVALLRIALLAFVVLTFGTAILLIMLIRSAARPFRRGARRDASPSS